MKFFTVFRHQDPKSNCGVKSLTQQQYKDDCEIESIMKRYQITGQLPPSRSVISGDFSDVGDYQACLDKVNKAKDEFAALPSSLRDRFGNDPSAYVDFILNPANVEECCKLGLMEKVEPPSDTAVDVLKRIESKVTSKEETAA